jgi:putative ABC transport system permease protein
VLAGIALLILSAACINFVNLTIARSSFRALEVGIKKIFGAGKKDLFLLFMSETIVISLVSLVISILSLRILVPLLSKYFEYTIFIPPSISGYLVPGLLLFAILVAFMAGAYPALFLSSFSPINVMRGNLLRGRKKPVFRNAMVTLSFIITIFLINSTLIIYQQLRYLNNADPGCDMKGIVVTPLRNQAMRFCDTGHYSFSPGVAPVGIRNVQEA